ncbi:molybdopterin synthase sulfur carrier subunit [Thermocrinis minervae]|uniref:Molybdopterin synthase sulfur carrier subunit n=2 Tax=Thermocrinis minervae TaxID=381751 RepID=A0A1M6S846_9AQUI|nr:molybdopterin synthase sulfur carrier subunit [Thermocrinis minervae]
MYFSIIREKLKKSQEDIDFQGSVKDLKGYLSERYPDLRHLIEASKVAVNEEYVDDDFPLKGGERVALIPPVSGG